MSINLFGTDGIRGQFGKDPFTIPQLVKLGQAVAVWAQKTYRNNPSLLLAHDTRLSCSLLKSAFKSGLLLYPLELCDAQVLPSPSVAALLHASQDFDIGIIISASHNPYQDNGIKIIDRFRGKLSHEDEQIISELFHNQETKSDYQSLGKEYHHDFKTEYCTLIDRYFEKNFLRGKKVVLDCAQGAAYELAPHIFSLYGAEVIPLFDQPNGLNINKQCGTLHPEVLKTKVIEHQADIGFAFDGDGDRVIAVNRLGQLKTGDDILALLLSHPLYQTMQAVVGTVMTNKGFEVYLNNKGKSLIRTQVGDKYVAQEMVKNKLLLGGEDSGHIIMHDYLHTGDGIFTALRIMQTILLQDNWDMETFTKFPQIHTTIPILYKKDLNKPPFFEIITKSEELLGQGRLVIRYSGTEPVLRIMVEDNDCDNAQYICSSLSKQLQEQLN
ncbi:MAG: phosphoglucosamine mutase [Candidatus Babeliales bacterium]